MVVDFVEHADPLAWGDGDGDATYASGFAPPQSQSRLLLPPPRSPPPSYGALERAQSSPTKARRLDSMRESYLRRPKL